MVTELMGEVMAKVGGGFGPVATTAMAETDEAATDEAEEAAMATDVMAAAVPERGFSLPAPLSGVVSWASRSAAGAVAALMSRQAR